ncbi:hypothetical protein GGR21_002945 [Dysgonomonas hofstadii]|uniref:TIGR01777 family protein n=1 Tax=Dysgonomonas hofstadii TaxID=637886 RepID=A0A840CPP5_9BACT|nr:TIGR01777 family oxidoreductase [Dysgonomonas hofstadii]MBB4037031.1 hypothetical protein [Dysgonomonas hofstadii]
MHIFITGGTGLIGSALIRTLLQQGHVITVLTRNQAKAEKKLGTAVRYCTSLESLKSMDKYDAVINLAGEPIAGKRWTKKQKERLCDSRWDITRRLTELIKTGDSPPSVYISGSAIGYYGAQADNLLTEIADSHDEFTYQLCKKWEGLAVAAESPNTRVCISRTGVVLSRKGGMLAMLSMPFKLGLGCVLGKGLQYISWIHIQDMVNGIIYLLNMPEARGVFNFTAPNPVTNKRFANILSSTLYRPQIFKIPSFLIKLVMGESATILLDGQRAIPQHLTDLHYRFTFEHLDEALRNLMKGKKK